MKIALTVWENRISPVFDSAKTLFIAEVENGKLINSQYLQFDPEKPSRLTDMLINQDVRVLICGAILEVSADMIDAGGIKLIPFVSGVTEEILEVYATGLPVTPKFLMPGCGRRRRRKNKQRKVLSSQSEEVVTMPKGNGAGPQGKGPGTGKGAGGCSTGKGGTSKGRGKGGGRGYGKGRGQAKKINPDI